MAAAIEIRMRRTWERLSPETRRRLVRWSGGAALRRALKRAADPDAAVLPTLRDVSDPWDMAKDGRSWFGRHLPELMRK